MFRRIAALGSLLMVLNAAVASADSEERGDGATRLPPEAFDELPAEVRENLEKRGCTIPQAYLWKEPGNVVKGRFTGKDKLDIAVLCSREMRSSILVFHGGSTGKVDELAPEPDSIFFQGTGRGTYGYSRAISAISPETIRRYYEWALEREWDVESELPPLEHDGIDDYFVEKASTIWYLHEGEWITLPGAD